MGRHYDAPATEITKESTCWLASLASDGISILSPTSKPLTWFFFAIILTVIQRRFESS